MWVNVGGQNKVEELYSKNTIPATPDDEKSLRRRERDLKSEDGDRRVRIVIRRER